MRLSTFIQDTMYEIALGVQLAQAKAKDLVAISPGKLDGNSLVELSYVDFDVSVVVEERKETKASGSGKLGGEISVASVFKVSRETGGEAETSDLQSVAQTHRVAFKVPVYLNASFKDNPATTAHAQPLFSNHAQDESQ